MSLEWFKPADRMPIKDHRVLVAFKELRQWGYLIAGWDGERWYSDLGEEDLDEPPEYWASIIGPYRHPPREFPSQVSSPK